MHHLPAPTNGTPLSVTVPLDVSKLPLWQRRYIAAIQRGAYPGDAAHYANCTKAAIDQWTKPGGARYDPAFARAVEIAESGVAVLGIEEARRLAMDSAAHLVNHAISMATNTDPATGEPMEVPIFDKEGKIVGHRDKVAPHVQGLFTRLGLETAGLVGRPPPDTTAAETAHAVIEELRAMRRATQERTVAWRAQRGLPVPDPVTDAPPA